MENNFDECILRYDEMASNYNVEYIAGGNFFETENWVLKTGLNSFFTKVLLSITGVLYNLLPQELLKIQSELLR